MGPIYRWLPTSTPRARAVALFGPNVGTTAGAALGALAGFTRRQTPDRRYARAAEVADAILLAVHARDAREAELLARVVAEQGGRDPRTEAR